MIIKVALAMIDIMSWSNYVMIDKIDFDIHRLSPSSLLTPYTKYGISFGNKYETNFDLRFHSDLHVAWSQETETIPSS